jgi:uncharacterized alkaline shock family protein YloU
MRIYDRVVLAVYTLTLDVLAVIFVLMAFGWRMPLDIVRTSLDNIQIRWLVGLISLFYLVISLRLIVYAFRRKYAGQAVVHDTSLGEVRISLDGIENLVKKVARQVQGVREVRGTVHMSADGLHVSLSIVMSPDISIPSVSSEVQSQVKSYVRNVVGVEVSEVRVQVENITAEVRRSRVE